VGLKMKIFVKNTFVPSQAKEIAASFRAAAGRAREQANSMNGVGSALTESWEGNSERTYMDNFCPGVSDLESYARWLDQTAHQIETMTVTTVELKDVPDQPKKR
jgi:uncharacterized protein YukE